MPLYSLSSAQICAAHLHQAPAWSLVLAAEQLQCVLKIDGLLCSWALISASMEAPPIQVRDLNALLHSMAALIQQPSET